MGICFGRSDHLHVQKIADSKNCREYLAEHCCYGCSHHPPFEQKDKNRVQNNVNCSSGKCRDHRKLGIPVCTNDRVHCLSKHIERNTQRNIKEIFLRVIEGLFIDRSTEHCNDLI